MGLTPDGSSTRPPAQAWVCDQCTYEHAGPEAELAACAICSNAQARPTGQQSIPLPSAPLLTEVQASESLDKEATPWTCQRCTYRHQDGEAALLVCVMCAAERSQPLPSEAATQDPASSQPQSKSPDVVPSTKAAPEQAVGASTRACSADGDGAGDDDEAGVCSV